jgi:hypothetical protein
VVEAILRFDSYSAWLLNSIIAAPHSCINAIALTFYLLFAFTYNSSLTLHEEVNGFITESILVTWRSWVSVGLALAKNWWYSFTNTKNMNRLGGFSCCANQWHFLLNLLLWTPKLGTQLSVIVCQILVSTLIYNNDYIWSKEMRDRTRSASRHARNMTRELHASSRTSDHAAWCRLHARHDVNVQASGYYKTRPLIQESWN